ncbi:MAG TPA: VCBS repeat-containing protein, partial [Thermoanaerobaculia bacterium]|nr:VCBS repeat-containing protein [Thermoanaerobaculia bacterium]
MTRLAAVLVLLLTLSGGIVHADECRRALSAAIPLFQRPVATALFEDFDHDGRSDLVISTALYGGQQLTMRGFGHGLYNDFYAAPSRYPAYGKLAGTMDLDGDHNLDILYDPATVDYGHDLNIVFNPVSFALGHGDGEFNAPTYVELEPYQWLRLVDLDGDSRRELVTGRGGIVQIYTIPGDGTFHLVGSFASHFLWGKSGMAAGDFDGDGRIDLCGVDYDPTRKQSRYSFFWNGGNFRFTETDLFAETPHDLSGLGIGTGSSGASIAVAVSNGELLTIAAPNRTSSVAVRPIDLAGSYTIFAGTADFDRDGQADLAFSSNATAAIVWGEADHTYRNVSVFITTGDGPDYNHPTVVTTASGVGDGTFRPLQTFARANIYYGIAAVGDFDGDHHLDLAIPYQEVIVGSRLAIYFGDGSGRFTGEPLVLDGLFGGSPIRYDASGHAALLVGKFEPSLQMGAPFLQMLDISATRETRLTPTNISRDYGAGIVDIDGDSVSEVLVRDNGALRILRWRGDHFDVVQELANANISSLAVIAADMNGDGRRDLYFYNSDVILLRQPDGNYARSLPGLGLVSSALFADLDGDGMPELMTTEQQNLAPSLVSILRMDPDGGFARIGEYQASESGVLLLQADDVDGDGRQDIVLLGRRGTEVLRNVCAEAPLFAAVDPERPREGQRMIVHFRGREPRRRFFLSIREGGKEAGGQIAFNEGGTLTWTTTAPAAGVHMYTITATEFGSPLSVQSLSVEVLPAAPARRRAVH